MEESLFHQRLLVGNSNMTMSAGHCPQTFMHDGVWTRSAHAVLSVYLLINCTNGKTCLTVCSFAFCSVINKLSFLELKFQPQELILCRNSHLRFQNNGYNWRNLCMSAASPPHCQLACQENGKCTSPPSMHFQCPKN